MTVAQSIRSNKRTLQFTVCLLTIIVLSTATSAIFPALADNNLAKTHPRETIVSSSKLLISEVKKANRSGGNVTIIIEDGTYNIDATIHIRADNISLISRTTDPASVIIQGGDDIRTAKAGNILKVSGDNFLLDGITLQHARFHLIQIAGENDADRPTIKNCILQDSYQQLFKVSTNNKNRGNTSDNGRIENCTFRYTAGTGPDYYIGGVDAHRATNWTISDNVFRDIASPREKTAEHAIHFWRNSRSNIVENNIIIDCDRGIGFGMGKPSKSVDSDKPSHGGIIRANKIIHTDTTDSFSDAGITLESSADTLVENNRIWLGHDYPNAIEYRFPSTKNVIIKGNITNKNIVGRNGGQARLSNNKTDAKLDEILKH